MDIEPSNTPENMYIAMHGIVAYDHYFHIQTREPFSQSIFPRAECPRQFSEDSTGHAA